MTPVVRLYWAIALVLLPLSGIWLHTSIGGTYSYDSLSSAPLQLILFLIFLAWTLEGTFELFFLRQ